MGSGDLRGGIRSGPGWNSLCSKLGLAQRVFLPGWIDDPSEAFKSADLFVLPSRYEGFPNALLEAMAAGLPVIAPIAPAGPTRSSATATTGSSSDAKVPSGWPPPWIGSCAMPTPDAFSPKKPPKFSSDSVPERYYARWEAVLDGRPEDDPVFGERVLLARTSARIPHAVG